MMSDRQSNSDEPTNGGITPTENREAGSSASDENRLSVQQSFFYRWRIRITAVVLVGAWFGVLFSAPLIRSGSLAAVLADYFGWLLFNSGLEDLGDHQHWRSKIAGNRQSRPLCILSQSAVCRNIPADIVRGVLFEEHNVCRGGDRPVYHVSLLRGIR